LLAHKLESLYETYNKLSFAERDPVRFLHEFDDPLDIEEVGLIASSLAYGRVGAIIRTVGCALDDIERSIGFPSGARGRAAGDTFGLPDSMMSRRNTVGDATRDVRFTECFEGFRYRFTDGTELASFVFAIRAVGREFGSLCECFRAHLEASDSTVLPALDGFTKELRSRAPSDIASLIPDPSRGSACKRLNLFLRWMVRKDNIDPGPWESISPSLLVVPLDTHMHRIGLRLGFTNRKQADIRTAIEITEGFRAIRPDDPVRYDFPLTHSSIAGAPFA
jgi:uncharacterized protein (TIGR02757 family)